MAEPVIDNQIIFAIRQISQAVETYSRYLWQEFGLTSPQLGTLRELERRGQSSPTQIAEWMSISPPTAAGILKRLKERGLIDRCRDPLDGRGAVVQITQEGRELAGRAPSLLRDQFRRELSQVADWERNQILSVLQRVASMMHAQDVEEVPFLFVDSGAAELAAPSKSPAPPSRPSEKRKVAAGRPDRPSPPAVARTPASVD